MSLLQRLRRRPPEPSNVDGAREIRDALQIMVRHRLAERVRLVDQALTALVEQRRTIGIDLNAMHRLNQDARDWLLELRHELSGDQPAAQAPRDTPNLEPAPPVTLPVRQPRCPDCGKVLDPGMSHYCQKVA